ncbi:hypothetical protein [Hydrogenophaga sp. BPS33]|uniref:hypothetical protein n=1 Tax=Hydrogenophaga sp. BPS33 TaxID=2651974 RepID=UPI0013200DE8|nr:hypothetical protein [Hydrogenophaga sp. BPS33]QHE88200.1 hypothetical protein F9K07_26540 [Hydrogenophaga sp. BPS33]
MAKGRHAVVAGTAHPALLRELLTHHGIQRTTLLTTRRFLRMPAGMDNAVLDAHRWSEGLPCADHALLLFGAVRREREALLWHPRRADLVALATALHGRGVRTLQLVLPGGVEPLSTAERRALKQLGFDQSARALAPSSVAPTSGSWPARLAAGMIHIILLSMQQVSAAQVRRGRTRTP